jgi:hypothetical protein
MSTQLKGETGVSQCQPGSVSQDDLAGFNTLPNYANDAAAASGGVAIGGMYRNGSVIMVRVA